jgi:hypothetical protein
MEVEETKGGQYRGKRSNKGTVIETDRDKERANASIQYEHFTMDLENSWSINSIIRYGDEYFGALYRHRLTLRPLVIIASTANQFYRIQAQTFNDDINLIKIDFQEASIKVPGCIQVIIELYETQLGIIPDLNLLDEMDEIFLQACGMSHHPIIDDDDDQGQGRVKRRYPVRAVRSKKHDNK